MKSKWLIGILATATLASQALGETIESTLQDPVATFTADGKPLAAIPGRDLVGHDGKYLPNGLFEVETPGGSVYVNGMALRLDLSVSKPPCTSIHPPKVAQRSNVATHDPEEVSLGTSGISGGCR